MSKRSFASKVTEEALRTERVESINLSAVNADTVQELTEIAAEAGEDALHVAGFYALFVISSLIDGLKDAPSVDEIAEEVGCSRSTARIIHTTLIPAVAQIRATRASRLGGALRSGTKKTQEPICPDLMDMTEDLEGAELSWA